MNGGLPPTRTAHTTALVLLLCTGASLVPTAAQSSGPTEDTVTFSANYGDDSGPKVVGEGQTFSFERAYLESKPTDVFELVSVDTLAGSPSVSVEPKTQDFKDQTPEGQTSFNIKRGSFFLAPGSERGYRIFADEVDQDSAEAELRILAPAAPEEDESSDSADGGTTDENILTEEDLSDLNIRTGEQSSPDTSMLYDSNFSEIQSPYGSFVNVTTGDVYETFYFLRVKPNNLTFVQTGSYGGIGSIARGNGAGQHRIYNISERNWVSAAGLTGSRGLIFCSSDGEEARVKVHLQSGVNWDDYMDESCAEPGVPSGAIATENKSFYQLEKSEFYSTDYSFNNRVSASSGEALNISGIYPSIYVWEVRNDKVHIIENGNKIGQYQYPTNSGLSTRIEPESSSTVRLNGYPDGRAVTVHVCSSGANDAVLNITDANYGEATSTATACSGIQNGEQDGGGDGDEQDPEVIPRSELSDSELKSQYGDVLREYDDNQDGSINSSESETAINALVDDNLPGEEAQAVITAFQRGLEFSFSTVDLTVDGTSNPTSTGEQVQFVADPNLAEGVSVDTYEIDFDNGNSVSTPADTSAPQAFNQDYAEPDTYTVEVVAEFTNGDTSQDTIELSIEQGGSDEGSSGGNDLAIDPESPSVGSSVTVSADVTESLAEDGYVVEVSGPESFSESKEVSEEQESDLSFTPSDSGDYSAKVVPQTFAGGLPFIEDIVQGGAETETSFEVAAPDTPVWIEFCNSNDYDIESLGQDLETAGECVGSEIAPAFFEEGGEAENVDVPQSFCQDVLDTNYIESQRVCGEEP